MDIAFLVLSIILIIGAVLLFLKRSSRNTVMTKAQRVLAVFQIVLCGSFFALCLSDALDIMVSFSGVRVFLNLFYAMAFLSLTVFGLSDLHRKKPQHVRLIICLGAALIAVQCFIFPYDAGNEFLRILQAVEAIVVFTMLVVLVTRMDDVRYGQIALGIIVVLELAVAVINTARPMPSITEDIETLDIPMNYMALYMRPVIFSSIALIYRVWLDLKDQSSGIRTKEHKNGKK